MLDHEEVISRLDSLDRSLLILSVDHALLIQRVEFLERVAKDARDNANR
jgi:hypothetical protein